MKLIFLGTPDFAVEVLKDVLLSKHEVLAVVCQPDKRGGRGQEMIEPPMKKFAKEKGLKVYQFESVRKEGAVLKSLNADVLCVAAFGQMFSEENLEMCKFGTINVHGSLLPKYRGSSPIQWAIINGESETGVTTMMTALKMDSGDILLQEKVEIDKNDTAGTLFEKLSHVGGKLLVRTLDELENGTLSRTKQDEKESTVFPMLRKENAKIDFSKTANEVRNFVRGLNPWPVAFFELNGNNIKVFETTVLSTKSGRIGEVVVSDDKNGLVVSCADLDLLISIIQAPGSKRMSSADFIRGRKIEKGTIL